MQGLLVRVAHALNDLWRHVGSVFADRFHARELRSPREVRAALVYVIQNARRHGWRLNGVDPCSSGPWFDGWKESSAIFLGRPVTNATCWLLCEGWRRHGLIGIDENPIGTSETRPWANSRSPAFHSLNSGHPG
jgi:hypothetical protein